MIVNVPRASDLDEMALRLYFETWSRTVSLFRNFSEEYDIDVDIVDGLSNFKGEWNEYVLFARSEMGAICATIQNSAELRLKSLICDTSPYLLLLNKNVPLNKNCKDIDFSDQRTLDATDLPFAVRSLTEFRLPEAYVEQYGDMRRLRNQIMHLGSYNIELTPRRIIGVLSQQYVALWPDGRWLFRRVQYDGNSAERFFDDERWSSVQSTVMAELPFTMMLLENVAFRKCFGIEKEKITGFCPDCMYARATKWDVYGHATAYRLTSDAAFCAMCEATLSLKTSEKTCDYCESKNLVEWPGDEREEPVCYDCGQ